MGTWAPLFPPEKLVAMWSLDHSVRGGGYFELTTKEIVEENVRRASGIGTPIALAF